MALGLRFATRGTAGRTLEHGAAAWRTTLGVGHVIVVARAQSQLPGQRKYQGTVSVLTTIYREEGATALYRGFLPKALRLGIGQTIGAVPWRGPWAWLWQCRGSVTQCALPGGGVAAGLMVFKGCLKAFGVHQQPDPQVLEASTAVS